MLQPDQIAKEDERTSGRAARPEAKLPSYQDLLDTALDDTFPASDPPAISAAAHVHEPHTTPRDSIDWTLEPGGCKPVGQPCDDGQGRPRSAPCDARLHQAVKLDDVVVPAGPCCIEQSEQTATLRWTDAGGAAQQRDISLEHLRQLLADGVLARDGDR
ncbi:MULTISPECIES: hypothetical protein [unclassified Roseateles]|uniref:hypothetical protein n=1 Tax=unclassified Roseateles TaxID=2626991 RepID=UPI0006F57EEB|nr:MULTISPECIES: hypothetical protein [unclassified Roseateles]KQW43274.1 hypothetical protein ASC81_15875 [Pelomonas sp. Root405]KRA71012.1 hypothetical protein ASD88_14400 [Pelomonas sp. Root662]